MCDSVHRGVSPEGAPLARIPPQEGGTPQETPPEWGPPPRRPPRRRPPGDPQEGGPPEGGPRRPPRRRPPPRRPPERDPQEGGPLEGGPQETPGKEPPQKEAPQEAESGIRSMSGRYVSYWNAFLSSTVLHFSTSALFFKSEEQAEKIIRNKLDRADTSKGLFLPKYISHHKYCTWSIFVDFCTLRDNMSKQNHLTTFSSIILFPNLQEEKMLRLEWSVLHHFLIID